ncbi:MAG: hypothetical protein P9L92_05510 [Candidatus Electryonea clarkiae]|nr:hypothetical protein [Candidatus Electryonea clarkiae]MDP8286710.1 hypothetical protein [Candidatus Electryonea clarkiae]
MIEKTDNHLVLLKLITSTTIALLLVIISSGPIHAAQKRLDPQVADSLVALTDDPLVKADYYSDAWLFEKELAVLQSSGSKDAETLWRLARTHIDLGERLEGKEALAKFEVALDQAQEAVDLNPKIAKAQQTLATACGRVALHKGVFQSLGLVKRVHKAALLAVATGDSIPVAMYILGRTHKKLLEKPKFARNLLGLGWVREDSVSYYFDKALKVSGGNMIQCRTEYADFLIQEKNDDSKAKALLEEALKLPIRDENDPKEIEWARKMLSDIAK